jgi:protein-S-isoprenylcysteine O-methyltransferase Ste14
MITYGQYSKSIAQKILVIVLEIIILWLSYMILFKCLGDQVLSWLKIQPTGGNHLRHSLLFTMNILLFISYLATILVFVRRQITWAEAFNQPLAFALYYLGFALLGYNTPQSVTWIDWLGVALVIIGLSMHFVAELQRHKFKKNPENKGRLMTTGLWSISRHANYFSDLVWVTGFSLLTRNWWSGLIIIFLLSFFYFYNIPLQEKYLAQKYKEQFDQYKKQTKAFIPFIL